MKAKAWPMLALLAGMTATPASAAPTGGTDPRLFGAHAGRGKPALFFSVREEFVPNGSVRVLAARGSTWRVVAEVAADEHLRSREIDIPAGFGHRLKLEVVPTGAVAHLDTVLVSGRPPRGLDGRLARKLAAADNDIVPLSELTNTPLAFGRGSRLTIAARIEPAVPSVEPVVYPTTNTYKPVTPASEFYRYQVGSTAMALRADGSLKGEGLGEPLFHESFVIGSGHPRSATYGWVGDDGRFLYVALDFTADNTSDPGKDYGALLVRTANGVRELRVTSADTRWGQGGFEYTPRVGWEHKVYEFAVPLEELGLRPGDEASLAFALYGTASAYVWFSVDPDGVDPNPGTAGMDFTFYVTYNSSVVAAPLRTDLWIDLDGDGAVDTAASPAAPLSGPGPWIGLGLASAAALMAWRRRRTLLPALGLAILALAGCPPAAEEPPAVTAVPEVFAMTGGAPYVNGNYMQDFSRAVRLDTAGTYDFEFLFEDSVGVPVTSGSATGTWTVTVN